MLRRGLGLVALSLLLCGCPHRLPPPSARPAPRAKSPSEALTLWRASRPERFKMVHQVAASHGGESHVMTGYMLGRRDGAFRVSATAAIGPRVFDVAKVDGQWQAKVHLAQVADRVDPKEIGQAIERVYFAECAGDGEPQGERFLYRCPLPSDPAFDTLELELDAAYLSPVRKRFFKGGQLELTIDYEGHRPFGPEWVAEKIHLRHRQDYRLDIALDEYVRDFPFEDATLVVR